MKHHFNAIFERDGDWWVATAVEIPGAFSQGKSIDEARENLLDAIHELLIARRELAEAEVSEKTGTVREKLFVEIE
jgi:predicted RNase H-like HicB family nuclease